MFIFSLIKFKKSGTTELSHVAQVFTQLLLGLQFLCKFNTMSVTQLIEHQFSIKFFPHLPHNAAQLISSLDDNCAATIKLNRTKSHRPETWKKVLHLFLFSF